MTTPELAGLSVHESFAEYAEDPSEVMVYVTRFINGDCGDLTGEDEILGFMRRSLEGRTRHGIYETKSLGRIHVLGNNEHIFAMPDLVFANEVVEDFCTINTCKCGEKHAPQIELQN